MKKFMVLLALSMSLAAFAKEGGNGGGVQVCKKNVELYDFYEGRSPLGHNIKIWESDKKLSMEQYLEKALGHVKADIPEVAGDVERMVEKILAIPKKELFVNISIPYLQDATVTVLEEGCQYQQVANWNERFAKLFISKKLFAQMNSMNQAGLIIHEAVYKLSRGTNVANETSDLVREVVARIFSDEKLTKADSEVISSEAARNEATRANCEIAKSKYLETEILGKKNPEIETKSLKVKLVDYCLKYCKIAEERQFCEEKQKELK